MCASNPARPGRRQVAAALLASSLLPALPASAGRAPALRPATLYSADQWDMAPAAGGPPYRIQISRPTEPPPPGGYPVLYVTDGDLTFPIAQIAMTMASWSGETRPAIIVGIGYGDMPAEEGGRRRRFDLTPTPADKPAGAAGGGEALFRFITQEVRPLVAARYPVNPDDQGLFGWSLGGLFVLDALFRHPDAFRHWLAVSPSIWWDGQVLLKQEAAFGERVRKGGIAPRIMITTAELEQAFEQVPPDMRADLEAARMIDNARALADRLARLPGKQGYAARYHLFTGEGHNSALPAALSRTLRFALES